MFMYHHSAALPKLAHPVSAPRADGPYARPPVTRSQLHRAHGNPGQNLLPIGSSYTSLNFAVAWAVTLLHIFPPPEQRSEAPGVRPQQQRAVKPRW